VPVPGTGNSGTGTGRLLLLSLVILFKEWMPRIRVSTCTGTYTELVRGLTLVGLREACPNVILVCVENDSEVQVGTFLSGACALRSTGTGTVSVMFQSV
jgi:hypothetical protein